jgi:hypothetical protein
VTRIPIACTLTVADAGDRVEEWRSFLADNVEEARRDGDVLHLRLRDSDAALCAAADLSAREKQCCEFFAFAITIEADARWLDITVPSDASAILDDFAGLLPH